MIQAQYDQKILQTLDVAGALSQGLVHLKEKRLYCSENIKMYDISLAIALVIFVYVSLTMCAYVYMYMSICWGYCLCLHYDYVGYTLSYFVLVSSYSIFNLVFVCNI